MSALIRGSEDQLDTIDVVCLFTFYYSIILFQFDSYLEEINQRKWKVFLFNIELMADEHLEQ